MRPVGDNSCSDVVLAAAPPRRDAISVGSSEGQVKSVRTRRHDAYEVQSPSLPLEAVPSPTVDASKAAYEAASIGPEDVQIT